MKRLVALLMTMTMVFCLAACGNKAGNEQSSGTEASGEETTQEEGTTAYGQGVTLDEVKAAVVDALGEEYWPSTEIPVEMMNDIYGISEDMYEEYLAEMPMISTNVDTLIIVKAKEDQVEAVESALNAYREIMVNDTMQYPMNVGKIQASRIATFGQYVCFVQLGADTMEASEISDEAVIEQCQQDNELALEVIENTLAKNQ